MSSPTTENQILVVLLFVAFTDIWLHNVPLCLQVMTEEDKNDRLNPLYIGPETLLSLYSEKNWGNFCLSYLLTNRDYSGVLGLAWEGKAGESLSLHLCLPAQLITFYDFNKAYSNMATAWLQ